jgi:hypothetical protein
MPRILQTFLKSRGFLGLTPADLFLAHSNKYLESRAEV